MAAVVDGAVAALGSSAGRVGLPTLMSLDLLICEMAEYSLTKLPEAYQAAVFMRLPGSKAPTRVYTLTRTHWFYRLSRDGAEVRCQRKCCVERHYIWMSRH